MYDSDRIDLIEKALQLLGLEKCNYCSEWDKQSNFKDIRIGKVDGAWITRRYCTNCAKIIIKNRSNNG
jgi:hypothetical protein